MLFRFSRRRVVNLYWSVSVLSAYSFPLGRTFDARRGGLTPNNNLVGASRSLTRAGTDFEGDDSGVMEEGLRTPITPLLEDDDEYCEVVDQYGYPAMERFCEPEDDEGNDFRWIRIEKGIDKLVQSMKTKENVLEQIILAKREQAKYGNAELYSRRWIYSTNDYQCNGYEIGKTDSLFKVMQFNTLAEGLSAGPDATPAFTIDPSSAYGQTEKSSYGGFSNVEHPEVALNFSLRRWRLLEVLVGYDGSSPFDIIAMEEVDRFYGFFAPLLRIFGYEGVFVPKTRSPSVRMGWYSDGCCMFWKQDVFELLSEKRIEYKVGSQVLLLVLLKHRSTGRHLLASVTHLKAQKSEVNEKIRCAQVNELVESLKEEMALVIDGWRLPIVDVLVMGDFNADAPTQTISNTSAIRNLLESSVSPNNIPCSLISVYQIDPPEDYFYTTWKTRGTSTTRRIIDYIFYGGSLSCHSYLAVPEPDELDTAKLPGLRYPSDHMAIAATFEFR